MLIAAKLFVYGFVVLGIKITKRDKRVWDWAEFPKWF